MSADPPPPRPRKRAASRRTSAGDEPVAAAIVEPSPAAPAAHDGEHHDGEHHDGEHHHDRFRTVLAVLIALISVMGAITTWRAEVAGSEAGQDNSQGQIVAATAAGLRQQQLAEALSEAHAAQRSYEDQKNFTLREQEANQASADVAEQLRFEAQEDNSVALKLLDLGFWSPDYVAHSTVELPTSVQYDVERRVNDLMREQEVDTDSQRWYDSANEELTTRNQLYGVDLLLVVALALVAIAQIVRRRRTAYAWALPGGSLFLAGLVLFALVEA